MTNKDFVKNLLSKNKWTRMYHRRKYLVDQFNQDNAIIVLSAGRTGTNSLARTIHQQYSKDRVNLLAFHRIGKSGLNFIKRMDGFGELDPLTFQRRMYRLYAYLLIPDIKKIDNRFRLVTNVREPLARQWSQFCLFNPDYIMEQPIETIHAQFKQLCHTFKSATTSWFDESYLPDTGINVYDYNFDKEKGYGFVGDGKIRGMIIKSEAARKESLSPQTSENTDTILHALHEFTGMPIPKWWVETEEDSLDKVKYYKRYKEVIRSFVADDDYLDYIYNSKYMKHFYTEEEITSFRIKWKQKDIG